MPTISGNLNLVTDRPVDSISEVWVRARKTRGHGDGLVVGVNDRVPVTDGAVEFTALPGAAVLVLVQNGMPLETLPMVVSDEAQQTLQRVVQAGEAAGETELRAIEQIAAEFAASIKLAEQYRTEAVSSASAASASESAAATSASKAKTSETKAKTSETNAKTSETNAASSAATAKSQQQSAWSHFNNAVTEAGKAADSAAAAKTSETNAASSASASASSASSSATQAGKSAASATQAASSRDAAKTSETNAAGSAAAAKTSETNAAQSSSTANTHRAAAAGSATAAAESATQAATARDAAQASQSAAKTSATTANAHRQAAATSESNAATHETNAGESATAAAGSATEAEGHADRAEIAADPDGLRDVLTQQIADLVDGAPEDLDTIREIAEYAQENRDITDQLNAAIGGKADKSHTHAWASITGRPDIPVTDTGYLTYDASDPADDYPPGVSYGLNNGSNQGWNDVIKADTGHDYFGGFVMVQTLRQGRYIKTTTQFAFSYNDAHKPVFIRKWYGDEWGSFRSLTDDGHKHAISDVTGLQTELDSKPTHNTMNSGLNGKADKSHTHTQAQITGLSTALNGKANTSHTHSQSQITGLSTALNGKADKSHKHAISDVTDLQTVLDSKPTHSTMNSGLNGKADKSHTHTTSQISGLGTALNGKADKSYVENRPALFSGSGAPPSSIAGAVAGDFWLDTSTMELHKITGV